MNAEEMRAVVIRHANAVVTASMLRGLQVHICLNDDDHGDEFYGPEILVSGRHRDAHIRFTAMPDGEDKPNGNVVAWASCAHQGYPERGGWREGFYDATDETRVQATIDRAIAWLETEIAADAADRARRGSE